MVIEAPGLWSSSTVVDYVDPGNRDYQLEMEQVATAHLQRIGAFLEPPAEPPVEEAGPWPVEASVIIPARNEQEALFTFLKRPDVTATNYRAEQAIRPA